MTRELPDTLIVIRSSEGATCWAPGVPGCRREAPTEAEALRLVKLALREQSARPSGGSETPFSPGPA